jgi:pimeloyl-ACP methyl ester carboxylesterase
MAKPTIFIPGFPASELHDKNTGEKLFPPPLTNIGGALQKLVQVPGDVVAGPPILDKIEKFAPAASTLYAILAGHGISEADGNFIPIGWDWRLSVASDDTDARVKKAIDDLTPQGKIVAIIHSTGGLVLRAFLRRHADYAARLEQVLAFGIPWRGTLEALHAVDKGAPIQIGPITLLSADRSKDLLTRAQAAYDLFPSDTATSLYEFSGAPSTPFADRTWLDPNRPYMNDRLDDAFPQSSEFADLPVTNVCGWGGDTWPLCKSANGALAFDDPVNEAGDGTVPFVSTSSLQGAQVRSMFLPIGAFGDEGLIPKVHGQIWAPKVVGQIFDEVFENAARKPFVTAAADKDQYIDPQAAHVRIRVAANGSDGEPLQNAKVSFRIGTQIQTHSLNGGKRIDLDLARGAFEQQVSNNIRRTEITVSWDGGSAKIPVLIMTA